MLKTIIIITVSRKFHVQILRKCSKKRDKRDHVKSIHKPPPAQIWRAILIIAFRYIFVNTWMFCQNCLICKPVGMPTETKGWHCTGFKGAWIRCPMFHLP